MIFDSPLLHTFCDPGNFVKVTGNEYLKCRAIFLVCYSIQQAKMLRSEDIVIQLFGHIWRMPDDQLLKTLMLGIVDGERPAQRWHF